MASALSSCATDRRLFPIGVALLFAAAVALVAFPPASDAQTQSRGERVGNRASSPSFTWRDEKIIREYFAGSTGGAGSAASMETPPRQPVKGERLQPAADGRALPRNLAIQLKPLPKGYERIIVDNDIVIVATRTGAITDVLLDAW